MFQELYKLLGNYSAYPLVLCSDEAKPGTLFQTIWDWFGHGSKPEKFISEEGCPWKLLGMKDKQAFYTSYPYQRSGASIIAGVIQDKIKFGGNLALPQFGFSTSASFIEEEVVKLTIGAILVDSFKVGYAHYELREKLRQLKNTNPMAWTWVDDDFLITDCFYTSEMCFEFDKKTDVDVKVTYERLKSKVSGGFNLEYINDTTLKLNGTAETPFAVRGIKI
jgi:hypothetical protein